MNRLTLERLVGDDEQPSDDDLVVPVIDGTPLFAMLDDSWPGLPMSLVAPPSGQWLGTPTYHVARDP